MIHIDFANSTVIVEPVGGPDPLAVLETLETEGSASQVLAQDESLIQETVRARSPGGRVLRAYDIKQPGEYVIRSGFRDQPGRTRIFRLRFGAVEGGLLTVDILSGSSPAAWVIEDHLTHYQAGSTLRLIIEVGDVVAVENAGQRELHRATAWERLLDDDPV